ncbi:hypothetical protein Ddye_006425 [Dipteronia dyeriana]|uniref:Uncharacterized protein n=1 Tax=Dipteronia dyeriana TaxID=168575 RepID=A0AAE0CQN7_9ROSI|nr:hypothetical protein Ddye_006425 [Dipteronia dyeriana]
MVSSSELGKAEPYLYKRPLKTFTTNHKHIANMANNQNSSILYPLLLTALLLISGNEALASRRLLDTTHPTVPELPKPELPHLPAIPTLPKPELPPLPKVELPPLPKPELPSAPHAPTLAKPELPPLPKPELPKMPELPALSHFPDLPKPTLPTIPSLPKDLPIPSFFLPHSTTNP